MIERRVPGRDRARRRGGCRWCGGRGRCSGGCGYGAAVRDDADFASRSFTRPITSCGSNGFGKHAVAARFVRARLIDRLERARQQEDGNMRELRRLLDVFRDLIPVLAGHADVREHDVGRRGFGAGDRLIAVADGNDR